MIDSPMDSSNKLEGCFSDVFCNIKSAGHSFNEQSNTLNASLIDTYLGTMIAIADESALFLLEFIACRHLEREVEWLQKRTNSAIIPGNTAPINLIREELNLYFLGKLNHFVTPVNTIGSDFQKSVWKALSVIPYGETRSYSDLAKAIGKPSACRAVANANGANQLAIIIPCHRVINSNGELGGYAGGISRKRGLINLEQRYS